MLRFPLIVLSALPAVGCINASETTGELQVQQVLTQLAPRGDVHVVLTSGPTRLGWTRTNYVAQPGPAALRAAVDRLAGCGQAEDDVLDVRVFVSAWPWTVRILEATPGAERCLEGVLSQLPLAADLTTGARYVASRTTVAALREPLPEADPEECKLTTPFGIGTQWMGAHVPRPADVAFAVTCASETPLTDLTVRYERGVLVEARTEPPVPCVEERARTAFGSASDLGVENPTDGRSPPETLEGWDTMTCTLPIPLRAR